MSTALRIQEFDDRMAAALRDEEGVTAESEMLRYAPPAVRTPAVPTVLPLPSYVEHRDDVDTVGKAAAVAIVEQYEGAMKALEAMGKELVSCVKQSQEMTEHALEAVKYVTETCDHYRDESKAMFLRIEHCSALTNEVRKVCEDMRQKIAK